MQVTAPAPGRPARAVRGVVANRELRRVERAFLAYAFDGEPAMKQAPQTVLGPGASYVIWSSRMPDRSIDPPLAWTMLVEKPLGEDW